MVSNRSRVLCCKRQPTVTSFDSVNPTVYCTAQALALALLCADADQLSRMKYLVDFCCNVWQYVLKLDSIIDAERR